MKLEVYPPRAVRVYTQFQLALTSGYWCGSGGILRQYIAELNDRDTQLWGIIQVEKGAFVPPCWRSLKVPSLDH